MIAETPLNTAHVTDRIRWRWGLLAAVAVMLIALSPQAYFAVRRGHEWNRANAISHPDEVAYSAYLASLIRGNPRRYDPFTGRGADANSSTESLFSVQLVPAYAVALPARALHLSAATVFIMLPAICALASSLALFWLLWLMTRDDRFSAASVAVILGFGTLSAGQGMARHVLNLPYLIPGWISNAVAPASVYHLPFLRLYQPAVAFPLFFVLIGLTSIALTRVSRRQTVLAATGAGLALALLIFSYFYLWTAAVSWLACLFLISLVVTKNERRRTLIVLGIVLVFAIAALIPYLSMLGHRAATVDAAQALAFTHRPDLFRLPEIVSLLALLLIGIGAVKGLSEFQNSTTIMAGSLALSVIVDFNQQIITGRTLQPVHFEWFIANYCALLAIVLTAALWLRRRAIASSRLVVIAAIALVFGLGEVWLASSISFAYNRTIDEGKPAADRLAQSSANFQPNSRQPVVLVSDLKLADRFPTDAPQPVLWSPRMLVFPGVTESENRERFWRQLYYLGYDETKFSEAVGQHDWNFLTGLFPYSRLSPVVTGSQAPITPEEVRAQMRAYLDYARTFNQDCAASPLLSHVIVRAADEPDYANLDRWYQRDSGERAGDFILYRVRLRERQ